MLIQCPRVFRTISAVLWACSVSRSKACHTSKDSVVSWDVSRWISTRPTQSAGIKPSSVYFTRSPCTRFLDIVAVTEARKQLRRWSRSDEKHITYSCDSQTRCFEPRSCKSVARALHKKVHSRGHHASRESCLKGTSQKPTRRGEATAQHETRDKATPKVQMNIEAACGDPFARVTGSSVIQRTAQADNKD